MTRSALREQVFKELFLIMFYDEDQFEEQCELYRESLTGITDEEQREFFRETLSDVTEEERKEIKEKVEAVIPHIPELDAAIDAVSEGWKIRRIGKVELSILRLAAYEMKYDDQVPVKVAINEAVELTKTYGGDESYAFVNAILRKLVPEDPVRAE